MHDHLAVRKDTRAAWPAAPCPPVRRARPAAARPRRVCAHGRRRRRCHARAQRTGHVLSGPVIRVSFIDQSQLAGGRHDCPGDWCGRAPPYPRSRRGRRSEASSSAAGRREAVNHACAGAPAISAVPVLPAMGTRCVRSCVRADGDNLAHRACESIGITPWQEARVVARALRPVPVPTAPARWRRRPQSRRKRARA